MTRIEVFSYDAEQIEKVCEDNGISVADVVEALVERLEEVKDDEGWI